MLYFADQGTILLTMLKIGAVGLAASAVLYAVWAVLTKKRFPTPMKTHILRYVFLTYLICVLSLTLPAPGRRCARRSESESNSFFQCYLRREQRAHHGDVSYHTQYHHVCAHGRAAPLCVQKSRVVRGDGAAFPGFDAHD